MRKIYQGVVLGFSSIRLVPHVLVLLASSRQDMIWADLARWSDVYRFGALGNVGRRVYLFVKMMTFLPEFRNLFYFRIGWFGRLFRSLCRPLPTLAIAADRIGPGLFIQHGFGTWIAAEAIGANCWINQQVTVGFSGGEAGRPIIGDNVTINVGAKVLGKVRLGHGSKVGANSVVLMDVPAGVTVMGVPATALWNRKISPRT